MKKERQKDKQKSDTGWVDGWMDVKAGLRTAYLQSKIAYLNDVVKMKCITVLRFKIFKVKRRLLRNRKF